jgi:hypothetical protein
MSLVMADVLRWFREIPQPVKINYLDIDGYIVSPRASRAMKSTSHARNYH